MNYKLIGHVSSWVTCNSSRERRTLDGSVELDRGDAADAANAIVNAAGRQDAVAYKYATTARMLPPHQLTTKRQCRLCRRRRGGVVRFE